MNESTLYAQVGEAAYCRPISHTSWSPHLSMYCSRIAFEITLIPSLYEEKQSIWSPYILYPQAFVHGTALPKVDSTPEIAVRSFQSILFASASATNVSAKGARGESYWERYFFNKAPRLSNPLSIRVI